MSTKFSPEGLSDKTYAYIVVQAHFVDDPKLSYSPNHVFQNVSIKEEPRLFSAYAKPRTTRVLRVKPGVYRVWYTIVGATFVFFDDPIKQLVFYAKPGEVVYIGRLGFYSDKLRWPQIIVDDQYEKAVADFRNAYPKDRRKLIRRIATHVRIPGFKRPYQRANSTCPREVQQKVITMPDGTQHRVYYGGCSLF